MKTHYLACGGFGCSNGHVNGLGLLTGLGAVIGVLAVMFVIAVVYAKSHPEAAQRWAERPREAPRRGQRYVHPVNVVTPSGVPVRIMCCRDRRPGHATAGQARDHAERVGNRIARTGR